jgi:hypothetical protein
VKHQENKKKQEFAEIKKELYQAYEQWENWRKFVNSNCGK